MLNHIAKPFTKCVERFLPDPFVFVILLTFMVLAIATLATPTSALDVLQIWGSGFWNLLTFSMQMVLVLLCGYMLANTPACIKLLDAIAEKPKSGGQAILLVTVVSMLASWINWGFGLVVGVIFAKALAQRVTVDYRVLIASSYSGFIVWHGGLSGSVPLTIATPSHFTSDLIGIINTELTLFAPFNLIILIALLIVLPILNRALLPPESEQIIIPASKLNEVPIDIPKATTPAERIEQSKVLGTTIGLLGLVYLLVYFVQQAGTLNLNSVIALFLFLSITLHQSAANLLRSLNEAVKGSAGIIIQFPFYAALMAVMVKTGLAASIAQGFINISDAQTLPLWSFLSAGLINIMVPSGGGQWAVQAPIVLPAALELGANIPKVAMAVAWGDAWTNLIQPFWALPVLAIAGLRAKDIMGFCLVQLFVTGAIIALCLTFIPA